MKLVRDRAGELTAKWISEMVFFSPLVAKCDGPARDLLGGITALQMADHLHHILEHAEGLGLPEGQYLRLANALRDVFNGGPAPAPAEYRPRHRFTIARPVKVSIYDGHRVPRFIKLISQTRTDAGPGRHAPYHTQYSYDDTSILQINSPFTQVVRDFLFLHQPRQVKIDTDIGSYVVKFNVEEKRNLKQVKRTTERLKIEGLTDSVKEQLEDSLAQIADFCYGDFIQEVCRHIPDSETLTYL